MRPSDTRYNAQAQADMLVDVQIRKNETWLLCL